MADEEETVNDDAGKEGKDTVEDTEIDETSGKAAEKPSVPSRGIPSSESMYLPPHYSKELRKFQDDSENPTRNYWALEEVVNFVFPKSYQDRYHSAAVLFMKQIAEKIEMNGDDIGAFVRANGISKATFYNRVLPRLKRVGMIKVYRETIVAAESKRKFRPMRVAISKTFGNYLAKIGDSWLAIVDDVRTRQK